MPSASTTAVRPPVPMSGRLKSKLGGAHHRALRATAQRSGPAVLIFPVGEVDASNVDGWEHLLHEMAATARVPGPVVVDVRELTFIGCCAYAVLARQAQSCRRRGLHLCLVSRQPIVGRMVAACGLRWMVPIHPTIDAALACARRGAC
jgi:anti-anti-sigma factor